MTVQDTDIAIIVTRPEKMARRTLGQLRELDLNARIIGAPVLAFEGIEGTIDQNQIAQWCNTFNALIVTSQNALHTLAPHLEAESPLKHLPVFCVGARTKDCAQAYGFLDCRSAQGNVQDLRGMLDECGEAVDALHLCGEDVHEGSTLLNAVTHPVYRMKKMEGWQDDVLQAVQNNKTLIFPVFSERSAQALAHIIQKYAFDKGAFDIWILCIGQDSVKSLQSLDCKDILVADRPDMAAMIEGIQCILHKIEGGKTKT